MDKINIGNLFGSKHVPETSEYKPLDVYSLYNHKENKEQRRIEFSVDKLLDEQEDRKRKLVAQYKKIFNLCLNKIMSANKVNQLEIIYDVPKNVYMYPEYSIDECTNFLIERLRKMHMDAFKLADKFVFISWKSVKENRERYDEEQKERDKEKQKK